MELIKNTPRYRKTWIPQFLQTDRHLKWSDNVNFLTNKIGGPINMWVVFIGGTRPQGIQKRDKRVFLNNSRVIRSKLREPSLTCFSYIAGFGENQWEIADAQEGQEIEVVWHLTEGGRIRWSRVTTILNTFPKSVKKRSEKSILLKAFY